MRGLPRISEAEWQVMRVLWAQSPLTANEVVEALAATTTWNPRTVKTLLNRLVKKGGLGFEQAGRTYLYHPLVTESACARAESRSFLQRVYGGAFAPMLASFMEGKELSAADIKELRRILNRKERK